MKAPNGDPPVLDAIDRRILAELQGNGRITNVELARRAGISAPPSLRRVRRLEEAGKFPKRVPVGDNRNAYLADEISQYQEERIALREASNARRWWGRHKRREVTIEAEYGECPDGQPLCLKAQRRKAGKQEGGKAEPG